MRSKLRQKLWKWKIWVHIQGPLQNRGREADERDGREEARSVDGESGPTLKSAQAAAPGGKEAPESELGCSRRTTLSERPFLSTGSRRQTAVRCEVNIHG